MSSSLDLTTARAIASSTDTAARLTMAGDQPGAARAISRAEVCLAELKARLPWHSRLVRQSQDLVDLARRTSIAPVKQENEETGLLDKARERLGRRTLRAGARARA